MVAPLQLLGAFRVPPRLHRILLPFSGSANPRLNVRLQSSKPLLEPSFSGFFASLDHLGRNPVRVELDSCVETKTALKNRKKRKKREGCGGKKMSGRAEADEDWDGPQKMAVSPVQYLGRRSGGGESASVPVLYVCAYHICRATRSRWHFRRTSMYFLPSSTQWLLGYFRPQLRTIDRTRANRDRSPGHPPHALLMSDAASWTCTRSSFMYLS